MELILHFPIGSITGSISDTLSVSKEEKDVNNSFLLSIITLLLSDVTVLFFFFFLSFRIGFS